MLIMGRRWSKQEFGIASGFALDVSASLTLLGTWAHNSSRSAIIAGWSVAAYDIACLIWLYCFWTAPKIEPPAFSACLPAEALHDAKKWEETLKEFMSQGKR
jgi:hypothetical protein